MIDISKINPKTIQACAKYQIEIPQYETIDEVRALIKKKRYQELKSKDYWKDMMKQRYQANPEKYRDQKNKSRAKLKEENLEKYLNNQKKWALGYYYRQKEKSREKVEVLELPVPEDTIQE